MRNVLIISMLSLLSLLLFFTSSMARLDPKIFEELAAKIEQETDNSQKSTLYVYRARNYIQEGRVEEGLGDLNEAIELDQSRGFIFLERSKLLLSLNELKKAKADALIAKEKAPALSLEADKIIDAVEKEESMLDENMPVLSISYLDYVESKEKSRHDVARELEQCETGHWIGKVSDNGSVIVLEDDSIWIVETQQQADASEWLSGDLVTACPKTNVLINRNNPKMIKQVSARRSE